MSVVDYLLNSLIKQLQKILKARKKKKKVKRKSRRKPYKSVKRKLSTKKHKTVSRKKSKLKRSAQKRTDTKNKKATGKKRKKVNSLKRKRKILKRPKVKLKVVKKIKKNVVESSDNKNLTTEVCIGEVTHYFSRIKVIVLKMTGSSLKVGDQIHVSGHGTDFTQKAGSLQIESIDVKIARKGQLVGLKVKRIAKVGSKVYRKIS